MRTSRGGSRGGPWSSARAQAGATPARHRRPAPGPRQRTRGRTSPAPEEAQEKVNVLIKLPQMQQSDEGNYRYWFVLTILLKSITKGT